MKRKPSQVIEKQMKTRFYKKCSRVAALHCPVCNTFSPVTRQDEVLQGCPFCYGKNQVVGTGKPTYYKVL